MVEGEVFAGGKAEGLNRVDLFPTVAPVPNLYQCFLHNIFCLLPIQGNAEGKPIENILQRQNIVSETDLFHRLSVGMTFGVGGMLHDTPSI